MRGMGMSGKVREVRALAAMPIDRPWRLEATHAAKTSGVVL